MGAERESLAVNGDYSAEAFERIAEGFVPADMDERWFVWTDDKHVVHIHRSWTGVELFAVAFAPDGDGYRIAGAEVNISEEAGRRRAEDDADVVAGMLRRMAAGGAP